MNPDKSHDYYIVFYINVKSIIVIDLKLKIVVECLTI